MPVHIRTYVFLPTQSLLHGSSTVTVPVYEWFEGLSGISTQEKAAITESWERINALLTGDIVALATLIGQQQGIHAATVVVQNINIFLYSDSVVYSACCMRSSVPKTLLPFLKKLFFVKCNFCITACAKECTESMTSVKLLNEPNNAVLYSSHYAIFLIVIGKISWNMSQS